MGSSVEPLRPPAIRYIKLGSGGIWNDFALEQDAIPLGFADAPHDLCAVGKWKEVAAALKDKGRSASAAAQDIRELKDFYELPNGTMWITFANGHLYWCQSSDKMEAGEGSAPPRYRETKGGWHRTDIAGTPLSVSDLSSALTKTASYRRTICTVDASDYLLHKINAQPNPIVVEIEDLQSKLVTLSQQMITALHWRDFELLIDLLFARSGWQRVSAAGDGEVDIDLLLEQPMTSQRAWVQIKSSANQAALDDYVGRFQRDGSASHFFFVCHSPKGELNIPDRRAELHLLTGKILAEKVLQSGLLEWLKHRVG